MASLLVAHALLQCNEERLAPTQAERFGARAITAVRALPFYKAGLGSSLNGVVVAPFRLFAMQKLFRRDRSNEDPNRSGFRVKDRVWVKQLGQAGVVHDIRRCGNAESEYYLLRVAFADCRLFSVLADPLAVEKCR